MAITRHPRPVAISSKHPPSPSERPRWPGCYPAWCSPRQTARWRSPVPTPPPTTRPPCSSTTCSTSGCAATSPGTAAGSSSGCTRAASTASPSGSSALTRATRPSRPTKAWCSCRCWHGALGGGRHGPDLPLRRRPPGGALDRPRVATTSRRSTRSSTSAPTASARWSRWRPWQERPRPADHARGDAGGGQLPGREVARRGAAGRHASWSCRWPTVPCWSRPTQRP